MNARRRLNYRKSWPKNANFKNFNVSRPLRVVEGVRNEWIGSMPRLLQEQG